MISSIGGTASDGYKFSAIVKLLKMILGSVSKTVTDTSDGN